jgi:hypothetical protein
VRHAHEAEPAPAVPPGICDGRVTNGQQSTDPNVADGGTPPETSRPDGIRTGGDTKPGRGCSTGTVEARPGAGEVHKQVWKMGEVATLSSAPPDARPGGRPGGVLEASPPTTSLGLGGPISTPWLLTKMSIRHPSYISTDLFWTKISTTNTKVAV